MRVLIVEDDEDIREVLGMILRAEGYQVDEAADGLDALEMIRKGAHPSVLIVDLMMPRLDGEGLLTILRRDPGFAQIPVVVTSGHRLAQQKAAELGAVRCLVKPIDLDALLMVMRDVESATSGHHADL